MDTFENADKKNGFTMKLRRGERMCLLSFDVDEPEDDFVGFAIEVRSPDSPDFWPLRNRLAFSYNKPAAEAVTGERQFPSTSAPFQKFRWIHFPYTPKAGSYVYRATKMHMRPDETLVAGDTMALDIPLGQVTYDGFLDVGFTRNFASSQAFRDRYFKEGKPPVIIPDVAEKGLTFHKKEGDVYRWLGFEAYDLLFELLDEASADESIEIDMLAYDLNEPDIVARLEQLRGRLRAIIDDSGAVEDGVKKGHVATTSAESKAAKRLRASAGPDHIKRTHFHSLQHHKVIIAKRNGQPYKVLIGSTNFSFRGLYIQANNLIVIHSQEAGRLFEQMFERAFGAPDAFKNDPLAKKWHVVKVPGKPTLQFCFSPHGSVDLSLNPISGAVDQATSSVLYSVAFLSQIKSGATRQAFNRLIARPVFSYGIVDSRGGLEVRKPDGSVGLVDFAYLSAKAPEPFRSEWSGGKGINIHHKFVVTDFNLPTAKVFTGSSNFSPSGEKGNGDHLVLIEDCKVATAYAIEALRVFDHLHFRTRMKEHKEKKKSKKPDPLTLRKPKAISEKPAWFDEYYVAGSQRETDRKLFSS